MTVDELKKAIVEIAKENNIQIVILFSSRATGSSKDNSDFDLAVKPSTLEGFFDFVSELEELPTLLMFDVINLQSDMISLNVLDSIEKEGQVLYEAVWRVKQAMCSFKGTYRKYSDDRVYIAGITSEFIPYQQKN